MCADYRRVHKKKITWKRNFESVRALGLQDVKRVFSEIESIDVKETDFLCSNCAKYFRKLAGEGPPGSASGSSSSSQEDQTYRQQEDYVDVLNESVASSSLGVSPFKPPGQVRSRPSYAKRKAEQLEKEFSKKCRRQIGLAYGEDVPHSVLQSDRSLEQWNLNLREAFLKAETVQERCRLLTLVPSSYSTTRILEVIPEATKYLITKARKLQGELGVWSSPESYETRNQTSAEDVDNALEYYTNDDLDCTVQSPRSRDVIMLHQGGQKRLVAKRYMTRTIREAYRLFKSAHPDSKLGLTKFYSLRPKWVSTSPYREECVCSYCANFSICVTTINSISEKSFSPEELKAMCMCASPTDQCKKGECGNCPTRRTFSADALSLHDIGDVELCLWDCGRLEKKSMTREAFADSCFWWVSRHIRHEFLKDAQRTAIRKEKQGVKPRTVVFHFDFSENWTVVLPDAVQSYHWKKAQITIFTCVMTTSKGARSFGVISDDTRHDSAFAVFALSRIEEWLDENGPLYCESVYISDGASAHFKNRYQAFEMAAKSTIAKWIFSAPGHGKGACDGVGGILKHTATVYNLRCRSAADLIQTAEDFVCKLQPRCTNVVLLHVTKEAAEDFRKMKLGHWKAAAAVPNIQRKLVWMRSTEWPGKIRFKASSASD